MAAQLTAGIDSLILKVDYPIESDNITRRDDLNGIKVWYSTTSGFTPPGQGTLAYDGQGLEITIAGLQAGTTYYVKYALISEIDPTIYTISQQLSGIAGAVTTNQLSSSLNNRINLIDTPTTGLVAKVSGLETTYGTTVSAAQSATEALASKVAAENAKVAAELAKDNANNSATTAINNANNSAQSATQALASKVAAENAKVAAELAKDNSATSATASEQSKVAAQTAKSAAEISATQAATSATNADSSASAASSSATTAANSASAALGSANAAATKATEAATSATNSQTSAQASETAKVAAQTAKSAAETSATQAATSATNADSSASAASSSATTAANSASAALGSANAASTSASSAATSATNSATSATASETAKVAAQTAKSAAETSATQAATSATNADSSASAASSSATTAANSASAALGSANAAATKATEAATSATNSATSATASETAKVAAQTAKSAAETSATNAATSATNADSSASAASSSATTAANSASAALGSANAASTSASNAATSATNSATSASASEESKVAAQTAKGAAETSATQAATSATNANSSASAASSSATTAANSASAALGSANAASTSASNAATSATNSATSATASEASKVAAQTAQSSASVSASQAATSATNASGSATSAATSLQQVQATIRGTSLALPLEQWTLNGQSIATITDGKVGDKALRLIGAGGAYPNQGNYIAINPGKKYRVRFWAKPSSNATGVLLFSLRQFITSNGSEAGPVNGGRSPYKPQGITRGAHIATYGDTWGEYNYLWTDADWQAGVKYFQPEFLDNYSVQTGYWDIQGFTIYDVTDTEVVSAAVQTEATARAATDGSLLAQYTVKVDNNGFVSGFGLASETISGVPTSNFEIRADKFSIVNPGVSLATITTLTRSGGTATAISESAHGLTVGDTITIRGVTNDTRWNGSYTVGTVTNSTTFTFALTIALTTPATGTIRAGKTTVPFTVSDGIVYINSVAIQSATITEAKIGNSAITSTKIATNAITADKITAGSITADKLKVNDISSINSRLGNIQGGSFAMGSGIGGFVVHTTTGTNYADFIAYDNKLTGDAPTLPINTLVWFRNSAPGSTSVVSATISVATQVGWSIGYSASAWIRTSSNTIKFYYNSATSNNPFIAASKYLTIGTCVRYDGGDSARAIVSDSSYILGVGPPPVTNSYIITVTTPGGENLPDPSTSTPQVYFNAAKYTITGAGTGVANSYPAGTVFVNNPFNGAVFINNTSTIHIGDLNKNIIFNPNSGLTVNGDLIATGNIQTNAVTQPVSAFTAGTVNSTPYTPWTDVQSLSITTTGQRVYISFSGNAFPTYTPPNGEIPGYYSYPTFRLIRDNIELMQSYNVPAMSYSETPTAGTYTYKVQIDTVGSISNRSMFIIETKK